MGQKTNGLWLEEFFLTTKYMKYTKNWVWI